MGFSDTDPVGEEKLAENWFWDKGDRVSSGVLLVPLSGFIISVMGRSRYRRLHYLGKCRYKPVEDYSNWIHIGENLGEAKFYAECRSCWKLGRELDAGRSDDSETPSSSNSGSPSD